MITVWFDGGMGPNSIKDRRLARAMYEAHQDAARELGYGVLDLGWKELDEASRELHIRVAQKLRERGAVK